MNWRELIQEVEELGKNKSMSNFLYDYHTEEAISSIKWMQADEGFFCPHRVGISDTYGYFYFEWDIDMVWFGGYCGLLLAWLPMPGMIVFSVRPHGSDPVFQARSFR